MRLLIAVGFVSLVAACGTSGSSRALTSVDAPGVALDYVNCEAAVGTATVTVSAVNDGLQPYYGRMYAGGVFTGGGDSNEPPGFLLRPLFSNTALTTVRDVIACEGGSTCTTVDFVADVLFARGEELGAHATQIRDAASTWQAAGTVTLTDFVYPEDSVGHVAGTIHVESTTPALTIDGAFDHTFCPGLLEAAL